MREIAFDTETTGFDPATGDRLVEIGCVEILDQARTGAEFHVYINPERDVPEAAVAVHGLTAERLKTEPVFAEVADRFLDFVGDAPLVAHNAAFDMRFINAELTRLGRQPIPMSRSIDTVQMARIRFPGAPASLDALCRRFGVDNSNRLLHGALLDAQLLAEVYLHLLGDRQRGFDLAADRRGGPGETDGRRRTVARPPRVHTPTPAELEAHQAFILKEVKAAIWLAED
ncbi:DNA polymerase III subunit epsilon [Tistrella mobilis]|uniref:DNA polymerase III subunit epsilon n=1 Tax=Tistrella mobilis (strain KA081020-065) TaxID=1110502 RepID=I3TR50_TISMK|nr:DNA polymerase III subunit epsilon [Tistrella mobilis]AFK55238.1 DNA polymerase III, epsilon subunit and related 3'-5' exonuclease [Tistrella mobilis KA081020-065]